MLPSFILSPSCPYRVGAGRSIIRWRGEEALSDSDCSSDVSTFVVIVYFVFSCTVSSVPGGGAVVCL